MTFYNETPLPAEMFAQLNLVGRMNGVVAIRGSFTAKPDRRIKICDEQDPFVWEDTYCGDPLTTPLQAATDLAPFKPGTDVTFRGSTYAPDGVPCPRWLCSIEVERRFKKTLQATGPRNWRPRYRAGIARLLDLTRTPAFVGWTLEDPAPADTTPLCWREAYGGSWPSSTDPSGQVHHPDNWIGIGWLHPDAAPKDEPIPAPRIEDPDDPINDWRRLDYVPQGFAPVAPFWEARRAHAGTMDDAWLSQRHPLLPRDFDYRFWQSAPAACIAEPWLQGHEVITLVNLHRRHPRLRIALPGVELSVRLVRPRRPDSIHTAVLDGVHIDFQGDADAVALTWRAGFAWSDDCDVVLQGGARG